MAFTDVGGKIILHSWGRFRALLFADCVVGDLLALDTANDGMILANTTTSIAARAVACENGTAGDTITCALAVELKASPTIAVGGVVTAGSFVAAATEISDAIYVGDAGKISSAVGTLKQHAGWVLAVGRVMVLPMNYLTDTNLNLAGTLQVGTTTTLTGIATLTAGVASQIIKGQRFAVTYNDIALADVAKGFWVAPAACKVVSAYEAHGTISSATGTLNVEKCTTGEAPGAGDVVLNASGWDMTSTVNTPVSIATAGGAGATLAASDELRLILTAATGTGYVDGVVTMLMEWV